MDAEWESFLYELELEAQTIMEWEEQEREAWHELQYQLEMERLS